MTDQIPPLRWSSLDRYFTERTEYAEKARQLITSQIGFEPDLRASEYSEILLRNSLELYNNGKISEKQLNNHISDFSNNVRLKILRHIPEQSHLIDRNLAENYCR